MSNSNNRLRAFADVVSLDAWHDNFAENDGSARIFADVGLRTARVGSDPDCPIRFHLSLRRAEIHLIIPENEPIRVKKSSIMRSEINKPIKRSVTTERSKEISSESDISGGLSIGIDGKGKAEAKGSKKQGDKKNERERIEEMREDFALRVECTKSKDDNYRWEVTSVDKRALSGPAWDSNVPRATLIDTSEKSKYGLSPSGVLFEARCRREDLIIDNIEIKDDSWMNRFVDNVLPRDKEVLVIQYIKNELIKEGLYTNNIEDKFGVIALASIVADED